MNVAIVTGGETREREISIRSAHNVSSIIDFGNTKTFILPEDNKNFIDTVNEFDIVIPVIHGIGGEDGAIQKILEDLEIPYIFSGVQAHEICLDKKRTKEALLKIGIMAPSDSDAFPLFAKPRFGGSSVASKLCSGPEELNNLINENPGIEIIKEEPINGREFTVGVIWHKGETITLPIVEIIPKGEFFDFENKYNPDKLAFEICPAEISKSLMNELQKQALNIHTYLNVRHISRSDFIVTPENKIYFLEINTIPGMTDTSLIPKMLAQSGITLKELLREWCILL
jgi:D-alanine-D-alanine ligase